MKAVHGIGKAGSRLDLAHKVDIVTSAIAIAVAPEIVAVRLLCDSVDFVASISYRQVPAFRLDREARSLKVCGRVYLSGRDAI